MNDHDLTRYPLAWPSHIPRTTRVEHSRFKQTFGRTRDALVRELHLLGASDIVISCNIPFNQSGLPYANRRPPEDKGVAVYFKRRNEQKCIPCDRWSTVEDNIHAIELTVAALRGLDRWGTNSIVDAAFSGFNELPATTAGESWWSVLGVTAEASIDQINAAYRDKARITHPDMGGKAEDFARIAAARDQAIAVQRTITL